MKPAANPAMQNQNTTELTDADVMAAVMNVFGHTPDTVEEKAAQINLKLSASDSLMVAAVVFDQAKNCQIPKSKHDPESDDVFPYPDFSAIREPRTPAVHGSVRASWDGTCREAHWRLTYPRELTEFYFPML